MDFNINIGCRRSCHLIANLLLHPSLIFLTHLKLDHRLKIPCNFHLPKNTTLQFLLALTII